MRIATAMEGVHYVLHAPQGDTYADLLFTMIERRDKRPPVTYTTFQARDLGGDTAELFKTAVREAYERFQPQAMLVGASCTAELIQDDPGGLARALGLADPGRSARAAGLPEEGELGRGRDILPAGARLLAELAQAGAERPKHARPALQSSRPDRARLPPSRRRRGDHRPPRAARHRRQCRRAARRDAADIARLGEADFNVVLYPEIALTGGAMAGAHLRAALHETVPIGVGATRAFIAEVAALAGVDAPPCLRDARRGCLGIRARSIQPISLASASSSSATRPMRSPPRASRGGVGFKVVGLGTYSREFAREVREAAKPTASSR